jgi:hypothetical protein
MNEEKDRRYCNFCDVELTDAFILGKTIYGMEADMCFSCNLGERNGTRATLRFPRWEVAEEARVGQSRFGFRLIVEEELLHAGKVTLLDH